MKVTLENLPEFGIGNNFENELFENDMPYIVYGDDIEGGLTLENPEKDGGTTPYWKEPSYERWWKMGPRPTE